MLIRSNNSQANIKLHIVVNSVLRHSNSFLLFNPWGCKVHICNWAVQQASLNNKRLSRWESFLKLMMVRNDSHLHVESLFLIREAYWTIQLCTLHPRFQLLNIFNISRWHPTAIVWMMMLLYMGNLFWSGKD